MRDLFRIGVLACFLIVGLAKATTIFVGSDTAGPVQLYGTDGTLIGVYGPADGTAAAADGAGGLFVAIPDLASSTINQYGLSGTLLNSFSFTAPGDSRDSAAYVIDLAPGAAGTLWLSTYTGEVYNLAGDGTILSSFDSGATSPGVAFDGIHLYTTSGPGFLSSSPFIYERNTSGTILNTIDTGLNDTLGIGFEQGNSTFWVGGFDVLSQVDLSGTILQSFAIPGTHYGVEAAPEPSTWILILTAAFGLAAWRSRGGLRTLSRKLLLAVSLAPMMHAAVSISSLTPNSSSPQPVGTSITFTAVASDTDPGALRYRFRVQPAGGAWSMLRDYSPAASVVWTPADTDGAYQIEVSVFNRSTNSTQAAAVPYAVSARATGSTPVVNPTNHPLVALYSAPACPVGSSMRVRFKLPTDILWQSTSLKTCYASSTMNFYIAGMRASSTYQLRQDVITGPRVVTGPTLTFTTGAVALSLPSTDAILPLKAPSSTTEPVTVFLGLTTVKPYAVDASLNVIWYATAPQTYATRLIPGGGYTVTYGYTTDLTNSGLRQYDLVGNLVKETNVERMNDQLTALGTGPINVFHHEIRELANGNYLVLAQRELVSSIQGPPNDIVGDAILVLDNNLQLLWAWDSTTHLDLTVPAFLGETCATGPALCVLLNSSSAHDWTHGNSAALTPDGNIVYSARHQDMVYKIAYANGTGDGHVIWKLGRNGDFTWLSSDQFPWFSHQHDASYVDATTFIVFDDGNTRAYFYKGNSRGQALSLDEVHLTVTPILNVDLGAYSGALGSAQRLMNGNYVFGNGFIGSQPNTQVSEWTASGTAVSNTHSPAMNYRCFRLRDLYSAPY